MYEHFVQTLHKRLPFSYSIETIFHGNVLRDFRNVFFILLPTELPRFLNLFTIIITHSDYLRSTRSVSMYQRSTFCSFCKKKLVFDEYVRRTRGLDQTHLPLLINISFFFFVLKSVLHFAHVHFRI